jgi:hypothetical protein
MGKVYLIKTEEQDYYKIGMTKKSVNERIEQLQVGSAEPLEFVCEFETRHFKRVEKRLHMLFSSKRMEGEWFALTEEDVMNFTEYCQQSHDIYESLIQAGNPFI